MLEDKVDMGAEMDIIDFLLAMDLLSRIDVDLKIKSKFVTYNDLCFV